MSIYVCGDIHGDLDIGLLSFSNWPESRELTEKDVVVILGDFGLIWGHPGTRCAKKDQYWLDWLGKRPYTVAFVDGNHENFDLINKLPTVVKWANEVGVVETSEKPIYHLRRGRKYTINGKSALALGGAESHDKGRRIEGLSWWPAEVWSSDDCERIAEQLPISVDYVLAHTCPQYVANLMFELYPRNCSVASAMNNLVDAISCKEWHFGHWHQNKEIDIDGKKYICHYRSKPWRLV
jgi:hypothetical protein